MHNLEIVVFGGGCFWCVEAVFQRLRGVVSTQSGYSGGSLANPTYEQVSQGSTGHAEVLKIEYDPNEINFSDLLKVFFATHDPTTLNRQGNDVGTQYRSVIFYTTDEQKQEAEEYIAKQTIRYAQGDPSQPRVEGSGADKKIVTELVPLDKFYPAEQYHQNYYNANSSQPYCSVVIGPKIQKLEKEFGELLT